LHAENKRLREELEFAGTRHLDLGGVQEAEGVLRRARDEAERLMAEARGRAVAVGAKSAGGTTDLGPFIAREREVLQSLADLIQPPREGVRHRLRRPVRGVAPPPAADPPAVAGPPVVAPQDQPTRAWTLEAAAGEAGSPRASSEDVADAADRHDDAVTAEPER